MLLVNYLKVHHTSKDMTLIQQKVARKKKYVPPAAIIYTSLEGFQINTIINRRRGV